MGKLKCIAEYFFGFIALGCVLLNAPSVRAEDAAPQPVAPSQRIITDRNGVVLDAKAPALAYLQLNKIAGARPLELSLETKSNKILVDAALTVAGLFA
jgi:hypothetical protein